MTIYFVTFRLILFAQKMLLHVVHIILNNFSEIYLSSLKLDYAVLSRTIKAFIPQHYPSVTKDLPKKFDW